MFRLSLNATAIEVRQAVTPTSPSRIVGALTAPGRSRLPRACSSGEGDHEEVYGARDGLGAGAIWLANAPTEKT